MPRSHTITQHLIHYAFISICIAGFFFSCFGFLIYRLLLKPLVFGLILLMTLPLAGRELLKKDHPVQSSHIDSNND